MSALCGLEITDVDVEVSGGEMPALGGSSSGYVSALAAAGIAIIGEKTLQDPFARLFLQDGEAKIAVASGEGHWRYEFITGMRWPGAQVFVLQGLPTGYENEVAPARTFGFEEEVPHLHAMGLARGLDLSSALVLGREGYVNEPLFPDEPARHKLLDAMGDLYLSGVPARFLDVVAERTGHRLHVEMASRLEMATVLA
jgi:UDP-3-O-acyl-N-acetylglucosamine deacetylase